MSAMASEITRVLVVYSNIFQADQRKHQSPASLAFVREIHRWPVNSPHKWPVTRKILPFDEVVMFLSGYIQRLYAMSFMPLGFWSRLITRLHVFVRTLVDDVSKTRSLLWRHNERDGVSYHRRPDCLLNRLFKRRSNKISKLRVTGLREGNSPVTSEFPAQRASNAENISIWWRHHEVQERVQFRAYLISIGFLPYRSTRLYQA